VQKIKYGISLANIIELKDIVAGEEVESFFERFDKGRLRFNIMLMVISNFNGSDLLHVFARLNKNLRKEMPKAGLLDQEKLIRVKQNTQ
jgi:hypothetical protein